MASYGTNQASIVQALVDFGFFRSAPVRCRRCLAWSVEPLSSVGSSFLRGCVAELIYRLDAEYCGPKREVLLVGRSRGGKSTIVKVAASGLRVLLAMSRILVQLKGTWLVSVGVLGCSWCF